MKLLAIVVLLPFSYIATGLGFAYEYLQHSFIAGRYRYSKFIEESE